MPARRPERTIKRRCANPDHSVAQERKGRGLVPAMFEVARTRGKPRLYCDATCADWVEKHYRVGADGSLVAVARKYRAGSWREAKAEAMTWKPDVDADVASGRLSAEQGREIIQIALTPTVDLDTVPATPDNSDGSRAIDDYNEAALAATNDYYTREAINMAANLPYIQRDFDGHPGLAVRFRYYTPKAKIGGKIVNGDGVKVSIIRPSDNTDWTRDILSAAQDYSSPFHDTAAQMIEEVSGEKWQARYHLYLDARRIAGRPTAIPLEGEAFSIALEDAR